RRAGPDAQPRAGGARAAGRSPAAALSRGATNPGLSRAGRPVGRDRRRAGLEPRGAPQAAGPRPRSRRGWTGTGSITVMSTSRESDRSPGAQAADDAPIASGQDPLPLVRHHRQRWRDGERLTVEAFLRECSPTTPGDGSPATLGDDELLD